MADDEDREWKYELTDLPTLGKEEDENRVPDTKPEAASDAAEPTGSVAGSLTHDREIRPQQLDRYNVAFLILGATLMGGVIVGSIADLPRIAGFSPLTVLLVASLLAMVLYQLLGDEART